MKICFNMTEILDINIPLNFWLIWTSFGNVFRKIYKKNLPTCIQERISSANTES